VSGAPLAPNILWRKLEMREQFVRTENSVRQMQNKSAPVNDVCTANAVDMSRALSQVRTRKDFYRLRFRRDAAGGDISEPTRK
jgi:hypothetical protein